MQHVYKPPNGKHSLHFIVLKLADKKKVRRNYRSAFSSLRDQGVRADLITYSQFSNYVIGKEGDQGTAFYEGARFSAEPFK